MANLSQVSRGPKVMIFVLRLKENIFENEFFTFNNFFFAFDNFDVNQSTVESTKSPMNDNIKHVNSSLCQFVLL